jgi:hypothetical protein
VVYFVNTTVVYISAMSREDPQLKIRLPAELKDLVEESAAANARSLNGEIVLRLQESFDGKAVVLPDQIRQRLVDRAKAHGWPLESELLHTLVDALEPPEDLPSAPVGVKREAKAAQRDALAEAVHRIEQELKQLARKPDIPIVVRGEALLLRWHQEDQQYHAEPMPLVSEGEPIIGPPRVKKAPRDPKRLHSK